MGVRGGAAHRRVTRREGEVLAGLGERLTNAEIAARLFISERTVESHVSSLLRKLQADDRYALAAIANRSSAGSVRVPLPTPLRHAASAPFIGPGLSSARAALAAPRAVRRLLWVRGEPGIGKTKLLAALGEALHSEGALVLYGRCDEVGGGPFRPFREAIRQWATAVPARVAAAAAGPHLVQLARLVPELEAGGTSSAAATEPHLMFEAVDALVSAIAEQSSVVLLLDDLQWADRSSLLLLAHLARSSRPGHVTLVAAHRDTDLSRDHPLADTLADLRRDGIDDRLSISPLDADAVRELAGDLGLDLADSELDRLAIETKGNPFFVVEIARHLASGGAGDVPESVREVIGRRLSRLGPVAHEALSIASVVGPEFSARLVARVGGLAAPTLDDALEAAVAASIIDELAGEIGRFTFSHDLIRQTLASAMSGNRRARLHWAVGQALVDETSDDLAAIAHHLAEGVLAGRPEPAVDACLAAAAAAAASAAWPEALAGFERAISLLDHARSEDADRRFRALDGHHRAARAVADYVTASRSAEAAIALSRRHGWTTRLARVVIDMTIWRAYQRGAGEAGQLELLDDALAALGQGHDGVRARLMARRSRVRCAVQHDETEHGSALDEAEAAVGLADRAVDPIARIEARDALGQALAVIGAADRLLRVGREMVDIADELPADEVRRDELLLPVDAARLTSAGRIAGHPEVVAEGLFRMEQAIERGGAPYAKAMLLRFRAGDALAAGRFADALALGEQTVATCPHDLNVSLGRWDIDTVIASLRNDLDVAAARLEAAVDRSAGGFPELRFQLAAVLAATEHRRAVHVFEDALTAGIPWTWSRHRALWAASDAAVRLGDLEAAGHLHTLLAPHRGTLLAAYDGCLVIDGSADTMLGRLEAALGRSDDADASFGAGLALEERNGHHALAARTRTWQAEAAARRGA